MKINLLPAEVLAGVFAALPLGRRFTASHVCTHWRSVALDSPELWTDIKPRGFGDGERVHELFLRSKAAPLSIASSSGSAVYDARFRYLLRQHIGRTRVLDLECSPVFAVLLMELPAPIMERLRIQAFASSTDTEASSPLHSSPETFQHPLPYLVDLSLQLAGAAEPLPCVRS